MCRMILPHITWYITMISLCLVVSFLPTALAFHIYVQDSVERCFIENVNERILITASYECLSELANNSCSLYFRLPNDKIGTRIDVSTKPKGKLSHISEVAGTHKVCIYCSAMHWMDSDRLKFFISVETADALDKFDNPKHYDFENINTAKKHEIESLIDRIQNFTHSISNIKDEQVLDDFITQKFYKLFNSVHTYILYFYLAEIAALCICVAYSIFHLNRYFKTQHLI